MINEKQIHNGDPIVYDFFFSEFIACKTFKIIPYEISWPKSVVDCVIKQ